MTWGEYKCRDEDCCVLCAVPSFPIIGIRAPVDEVCCRKRTRNDMEGCERRRRTTRTAPVVHRVTALMRLDIAVVAEVHVECFALGISRSMTHLKLLLIEKREKMDGSLRHVKT